MLQIDKFNRKKVREVDEMNKANIEMAVKTM